MVSCRARIGSRCTRGEEGTDCNLWSVEERLVERGESSCAAAFADGVPDGRGSLGGVLVRDARHALRVSCWRCRSESEEFRPRSFIRPKMPSRGLRSVSLYTPLFCPFTASDSCTVSCSELQLSVQVNRTDPPPLRPRHRALSSLADLVIDCTLSTRTRPASSCYNVLRAFISSRSGLPLGLQRTRKVGHPRRVPRSVSDSGRIGSHVCMRTAPTDSTPTRPVDWYDNEHVPLRMQQCVSPSVPPSPLPAVMEPVHKG